MFLVWLARDVLRQKKYGKEVDWWSFGILLFRMLAGAVPCASVPDCDYQEIYLCHEQL